MRYATTITKSPLQLVVPTTWRRQDDLKATQEATGCLPCSLGVPETLIMPKIYLVLRQWCFQGLGVLISFLVCTPSALRTLHCSVPSSRNSARTRQSLQHSAPFGSPPHDLEVACFLTTSAIHAVIPAPYSTPVPNPRVILPNPELGTDLQKKPARKVLKPRSRPEVNSTRRWLL